MQVFKPLITTGIETKQIIIIIILAATMAIITGAWEVILKTIVKKQKIRDQRKN